MMNNLLKTEMSFAEFGLHESLLKVLPEIGYEKPTPIQLQAIPMVLSGKDLLGSAQTGTGKTAAFLLPILHRLLTDPGQGTQVLVLEPTRELALQVEEQAKVFSKYTELRSACVYGGVAFGPQEKAFADGVEVIAATPGRLLDHLRQGNARFNKLRVLVLDEVDRMLDMGFLPDVRSILRQLPEQRQTLFFSATVPSEIGRLADNMLKEPGKIAIAPDRKTAEGITQQIFPVTEHLKARLLEKILTHERVTSALVFTRTKQGADKVCAVIERQGLPVSRIHGDLSQSQRLKALVQFKEGEVKFLVATDIAARGLDVDGISHVINYDLPDSPDDYVHRIGRTARAGETGHAFSLFSPRDAAALSAIEKHLSQKIEKVTMSDFNYEEELGVQHEVRQGHNVRDYEDLGQPGSGPSPAAYAAASRPRPFKDVDERASVTVLYASDQSPDQASSEPEGRSSSSFSDDGGDRGDRGDKRRRRSRGGRGGRDRDREAPSGASAGRPADASRADRAPERGRRDGGGPGFGRQDRSAGRGDRHQANAALSATEVLRKASDQKALVNNDMMDLRPRSDGADEAPAEAAPERAPRLDGGRPEGGRPDGPRADGLGGGKKRRRRRRGGKGGGLEGQAQAQGQAGNSGRGPRDGQPQGRDGQRRDGQGREGQGRDGRRGGRNDRDDRRPSHPVEAKPSLWQRLKSSLGLGSSGGGNLGDKW